MLERSLCIHGHFYQPPRENPWLEDIEVQDSAHPYHDWNERITRECYAPNAASRILDGRGRIVEIVDNYRDISFNFGPTLLSWLARKEPETYRRLLEADRESVKARSGHGNALAQVYNHLIMPLASARDRHTQVSWGLRDFESRFGRKAEGMWLPETAVNRETLESLAAQGVKFTILSPTQALRVRPIRRASDRSEGATPAGDWQEVSGGRIDPSRPYLWRSPTGAGLALFFYDSPISHAVAFEGILSSGDVFADRLLSGFSPDRRGPQLMHIATDGESYGHHHRFGDMALAFALKRIRESGAARLTNYGEYLENYPPTWEVEIIENSSWSCAHGVERWRSNCGCRLGGHGGWTQEWRTPLRDALNKLAAGLDDVFEERGAPLLKDVWAARNDYIGVLLDRSAVSLAGFFKTHAARELSEGQQTEALRLLEMQRQRLLMFTSCAWFFDEISGLESTTVLTSAARALQIASLYPEGARLEPAFTAHLAQARSNIPAVGHGAAVYERFVKPLATDLPRIAAHEALRALWRGEDGQGAVYCFDYEFLDRRTERTGGTALSAGRIRVQSRITRESLEAAYAVLHLGGHDFHCVLKAAPDPAFARSMADRLGQAFLGGTITEVLALFAQNFEPRVYGLEDLLLEERRHILGSVIEDILERFEGAYRRLVDENKKLMNYLIKAGFPMPHAFRLALEAVLGRDMPRALQQFQKDESASDYLTRGHAEAKAFHVGLSWEGIARIVQSRLEAHVAEVVKSPSPKAASKALALIDVIETLELPVSFWATETAYFEAWNDTLRSQVRQAPESRAQRPYKDLAEKLRLVTD